MTALSRKITLSVDVPTIDVLHTVSLNLNLNNDTSAATIGRPLPATLKISHTRRWADTETTSSSPLAFTYTLDTTSDSPWLIAGPKRARFTITNEDKETTISLVLVPLRAGLHLLPTIDIQPATAETVTTASDGVSRLLSPGQNSASAEEEVDRPIVNCETDYRNSGETVLVIRDERTRAVTVKERDSAQMLQRISTATESVRASGESARTSRIMGA